MSRENEFDQSTVVTHKANTDSHKTSARVVPRDCDGDLTCIESSKPPELIPLIQSVGLWKQKPSCLHSKMRKTLQRKSMRWKETEQQPDRERKRERDLDCQYFTLSKETQGKYMAENNSLSRQTVYLQPKSLSRQVCSLSGHLGNAVGQLFAVKHSSNLSEWGETEIYKKNGV